MPYMKRQVVFTDIGSELKLTVSQSQLSKRNAHTPRPPQDPTSPVLDFIIPSLLGFLLVPRIPPDRTLQDTYRIYNTLMHSLDYTSHAAPARPHTTMCPGAPPPSFPLERATMARAKIVASHPSTKATRPTQSHMRTRPQTMSTILTDRPG
ncbi:hypothetical protein T440DRAFT_532203 [Plenodomus tracheiphilus IPT5]|uniref:Uncharacterized protein n=1 Tax=Plenodomus tracheiphilus IPT5 TaxID=1408161 RepID=A0A6A7B6L9_9PLEO|nr:hypothetical protein T440DRAFT_532203 [Plenodomus tracheiphilus IPT5]